MFKFCRNKLLHVLGNSNVEGFEVTLKGDGFFLIYCKSNGDMDVVVSNKCIKSLNDAKFTTDLPPGIKARISSILTRLNELLNLQTK